MQTEKPGVEEYPQYSEGYISMVGEGDIVDLLAREIEVTSALLREIPESKAGFRYSADKWTIREVVGHLIDTERVMAFRALSFARGDKNEIAGMDQDQYVSEAEYDSCKISSLIDEYEALRKANVGFFKSIPEKSWDRGGVASGNFVTVRALAYIISGHELHHIKILKERYLGSPDFEN